MNGKGEFIAVLEFAKRAGTDDLFQSADIKKEQLDEGLICFRCISKQQNFGKVNN